MSRPKIHHFNPKSILRRFSIDGKGKRVWVYDKQARAHYTEGISTAGGEKYFNQLVMDGKGFTFEGAFQGLDDALPLVVDEIITSESLGGLDVASRETLALLATVQFLRVSLIRATVRRLPEQFRRSLEEAGLGEMAARIPSLTENEARKIALSLLRNSKKLAAHLTSKELTLCKAPPDRQFLTSDAPVVMANHFPHGDLALGARGVEVFWPLSPSCLLSFRCPSVRADWAHSAPDVAEFLASEPLLRCRPGDVDWFNHLQVAQSMRFLYSATDDFSIADSMTDQEGGGVRESLVIAGRMGTMPEKKGMPPGITLIASGRETEHLIPVDRWEHHDGGYRLVVSATAAPLVERLLGDEPFALAEVHDTDGPGAGMRDVSIRQVSGNPWTLIVAHSDSALRALSRQIARTDR